MRRPLSKRIEGSCHRFDRRDVTAHHPLNLGHRTRPAGLRGSDGSADEIRPETRRRPEERVAFGHSGPERKRARPAAGRRAEGGNPRRRGPSHRGRAQGPTQAGWRHRSGAETLPRSIRLAAHRVAQFDDGMPPKPLECTDGSFMLRGDHPRRAEGRGEGSPDLDVGQPRRRPSGCLDGDGLEV